jgi:Ras-related protein Rab-8A
LIGNKSDWVDKKAITEDQGAFHEKRFERRKINNNLGRALADELGIKFMETSAKANEGVEDAFFTLARWVLCM